MLGGTCVDCFDSENGYVSKPTFEADGSVSFPVFDTADVQAALSSDVQPLFPARTYTSMDVLE